MVWKTTKAFLWVSSTFFLSFFFIFFIFFHHFVRVDLSSFWFDDTLLLFEFILFDFDLGVFLYTPSFMNLFLRNSCCVRLNWLLLNDPCSVWIFLKEKFCIRLRERCNGYFHDFLLWDEKNGHITFWILIALIFKKISFCNRVQWLSTLVNFFSLYFFYMS